MPLSEMIDSYCESAGFATRHKLRDFFDFVKSTYPDKGYSKIQREHLSAKNVALLIAAKMASPEHKYLDLPYWVHSKFNIGSALLLEKYAEQDILDLGAGPAHFGLLAKYFRCRYTGLDVRYSPRTPATSRHLYDDLCSFFEVDRVIKMIMPFERLAIPGRFRLVTCLMGNFCSYKPVNGTQRKPWDWPEWAFLLDDLATNQLTPEYDMYFQISRDYLQGNVIANVRKFAKTFDEERSVFTFDQTLDIDAVRRSVPEVR